MQYIQRDKLVHIEWSIFRGTSQVPEDFSRALVKMFLIGGNEKYLLTATAEGGKLLADLPGDLPEGAYSLEAIWVKNYGNLLPHRQPLTPGGEPVCLRRPGPHPNDPCFIHPHDNRFNDRCLMRSRKDYVFALTDYPSEETVTGESGEVTVRLASSVATYGYDGLSAYQIAVMRGDFSGTEGEYQESLKYKLEAATETTLGGIKAAQKTEEDTVEVKIDPETGKLYVPAAESGQLEAATETELGGIKASAKTDNETVEAKIGPDGKLYVPAAKSEELKAATETTLGGIKAAQKTEEDTVEVKIDPETGKLYVPKGDEELKAATETTLGGIKAANKTSSETQEVKIDPETGKLYVQPTANVTEIVNKPDDEDLHTVENSEGVEVLQFSDKEYNASAFSGLGRVFLRKNISSGKNVLTQAMMNKANTRYIIQYDYDLDGETITVPEDCTLDFQGGSFKNGILKGNRTRVYAGLEKIFSTDLELSETWNIEGIYAEWFGAINDMETDSYEQLSHSVSICDSIQVPLLMKSNVKFMVTQPLNLPRFGITGEGKDTCVIYSKIANETSDTMAFTYGVPNDYNYRSVIKGISLRAYDQSTSICNILNVCTPSRGARLENCALATGAGSCLVFSESFYYELNNVVFSGEWFESSAGSTYKGVGFSFGQDGSEINNITFNKCDFRDLLCFCDSELNMFAGSNAIAVNNSAIERIGEGLGDLSGMWITFNSCYIESLCLNDENEKTYSVAKTGTGDVEFKNCLLNFSSLPKDKPLFQTFIGNIVMEHNTVTVSTESTFFAPLSYSSNGTLIVNKQDAFCTTNKVGSCPPIYNRFHQQHITYDRGEDKSRGYSYNVSEAELAYKTVERFVRRVKSIYDQNSYNFVERIAGTLMFRNSTRYHLIIEGDVYLNFNNDSNDLAYLHQKLYVNIGGEEYSDGEIELTKLEETRVDSNNYLSTNFNLFKLRYVGVSEANAEITAFRVVSNAISFQKTTDSISKDILMTMKFRLLPVSDAESNLSMTLI